MLMPGGKHSRQREPEVEDSWYITEQQHSCGGSEKECSQGGQSTKGGGQIMQGIMG